MSRPAPASFHRRLRRSSSATTRRATALVVQALALAFAFAANADVPTPGGAPGSATGDGARPFTGLAETPRAASFTGAAVTSIPLELPPGRAGATPRLELHYSSTDGPSAYGYGWSLPIARVVRSTKHGVPHYDATDTFVLETNGGSMELEPVAGTRRFAAKNDGSFLRIGFDAPHNRWKIIDKSGSVLLFGSSAAERTGSDPAHVEGTFAWLLTRTTDASGNHVDYTYVERGPGEPSSCGLPSRIDYGGNPRARLPHMFSARFTYTTPHYPSVAPLSFQAGFPQARNRLLLAAETYVGNTIVRRYALSHDQDAASGAVRLVGVSLDGFAADAALDVALPSTTFSYSAAVSTDWPVGSQTARYALADDVPSPGAIRDIGANVRFDTFDINGDGLVDWVDTRPSQAVVRLGTGTAFAAAVPWAWPAATHVIRKVDEDNNNLEINVFDIDADGLPDLVEARADYCRPQRWCVYRNTGSGFEVNATLWPAPRNDIRNTDESGNRVLMDVADLNGDGRPDFVDTTVFNYDTSQYWNVYWNTGSGFAANAYRFRAHRRHLSRARSVDGHKQLFYGLFDMNGDGLPDFVVADVAPETPDHWNVYLNRGDGFEDQPLRWRIESPAGIPPPNFINETSGGPSSSYTYIDLVDVTGDGLPDWLVPWGAPEFGFDPAACDQSPVCTWSGTTAPPQCCWSLAVFVNTGSSFSAPVPWAAWHESELRHTRDSVPSGERQFDLLDFDGDGLIDLVEIEGGPWHLFRHPASPLAKWSQVPLERRARPNLLLSMMNGVGGETHLAYAPASRFVKNRIPFPYWAVVRRQVRDGITNASAASSAYRYAGGLWAGAERELRGFHHVWETDAAGITAATEYHQDTRRQGLVLESQVLGPAPCNPRDFMDANDPCSPLNDRMRVDTNAWSGIGPVLLEARLSTPYYRNVAVFELSKLSGYEYDVYGNVVKETVYSPSVGSVQTETAYAYSLAEDADGIPQRYLVDKPVHVVTRSMGSQGKVLTEKTIDYDEPVPVTGLPARVSTCIAWASGACTRSKTIAYRYDKAGNVAAVVAANGGATENEYDDSLLYARSVRNAAGHVTTSVHDLRTGRETLKRTADGRTFETAYDGLGRPVASWGDGFTRTQPLISTSYKDGVPNGTPGYVRTRQYGTAPVAVFFDGLGRELASKTVVETTGGERTIVGGLKLYDAAGRATAQSVTFAARDPRIEVLEATASDAPAWTRSVYDDHSRLRETVLPDGTKTMRDSSMPGVRVTVYANLAGGEHPGKADVELVDGFDRVWRKDVCSASPPASDPTRCPAGTLIDRTGYEYDGLDRPVRIVSSAQTQDPAVTLLAYDGLGNRIGFASSDLGEWSYEYDSEGLLSKAVDPRGAAVTNEYDKIGRLRRQRGNGFDARYTYQRQQPGTGLVRRIRARSDDAQVSKEFTYDSRGRVVLEEMRIRAGGPTLRNTTAYEYDDADRRVAVTYPGARSGETRKVVTTYSRYGQPVALTAFDGDRATEIIRDVGYDLLGNTRVVRYGNGLSDVFGYAPAERLSHLDCIRTTRDLTPSPTCQADTQDERRLALWSRDEAGNVLSVTDYLHASGSPLRDDRAFAYDSFGRLTNVSGTTVETFAYDVHGNVSSAQGAYGYAAGAPHRPTLGSDQAIEHDAAGNRIRKGAWTYAYDGMGRMTEVRRSGRLQERESYDEGRSRVARYDAQTDSVRYFVGGLFETQGSTLVRHYWLGGRIVASDVIPAPRELRLAATTSAAPRPTLQPAALPDDGVDARNRLGDACAYAFLFSLALLVACALVRDPLRSGTAIVTAVTFVVATTPFAASGGSKSVLSTMVAEAAEPAPTLLFYHPDHLGSPYMVSDSSSTIVEQRRYDSYGKLRAIIDEHGAVSEQSATSVAFTGQIADGGSGLIYFGARFYDPELGLFLTPDPQAQFSSPYLYGGGNPVNGADADGEFIFGFLAAVLAPILFSAAVSAVVSGVSAALQGGDFLKAFGSGFVNGVIGGAVGTVLGGLNVAYQFFAGGLQYIQAAEALDKIVEVSARSAFTSAVSQSAVAVADAAGVSSDWVTAISVVTPLLASFSYDNYIIKDSGAGGPPSASQRQLAKQGLEQVNTAVGHTNVTEAAMQGTGWERYEGELVKANLAQDGPPATGHAVRDFFRGAKAVLTNEGHFGRLPSSVNGLGTRVDAVLESTVSATKGSGSMLPSDLFLPYREAVGAATHYVQDHLTLGHMVPGTALFGGPLGAPVRFVIHQVFGGEIAFRDAQIRATHDFLLSHGVAT